MRLAALLLAVGAVVLGTAAPAQAHNYLVASTPEADSTVTALPEVFSVTTNEPLLNLSGDGSGFALQVKDAAGAFYGDGCYSIVDSTLSMGASLGDSGTYTLVWQVVSADGHPVSGELEFAWEPTDAAEVSAGAASPPSCGRDTSGPVATGVPQERGNAALSDVLWVGGAIAAIVVASVIALLVLSRRRASKA